MSDAESEKIVRLKKEIRDFKLAAENVRLATAKTIAEINARVDEARARADEAEALALLAAGAAVHRPVQPPRPPQQLSVIEGLGFCVTSPSNGCGVFHQENLVSFTMNAKPHLDSLRGLSCATSLQLLSDNSPASLLSEENLYGFATKFTPEWVEATSRSKMTTGSKSAKTIFCKGASPPVLPNFKSLPWGCMPELLTSSRVPHPPRMQRPSQISPFKRRAHSQDVRRAPHVRFSWHSGLPVWRRPCWPPALLLLPACWLWTGGVSSCGLSRGRRVDRQAFRVRRVAALFPRLARARGRHCRAAGSGLQRRRGGPQPGRRARAELVGAGPGRHRVGFGGAPLCFVEC